MADLKALQLWNGGLIYYEKKKKKDEVFCQEPLKVVAWWEEVKPLLALWVWGPSWKTVCLLFPEQLIWDAERSKDLPLSIVSIEAGEISFFSAIKLSLPFLEGLYLRSIASRVRNFSGRRLMVALSLLSTVCIVRFFTSAQYVFQNQVLSATSVPDNPCSAALERQPGVF